MRRIRLASAILAVIVVVFLIWYLFLRGPSDMKRDIVLGDAAGKESTEFQLHESVIFRANGLAPRTGYRVRITREDGFVVSELRLSTDESGTIPETVVWYGIGLLPCAKMREPTPFRARASAAEISDSSFVGRDYTLTIWESEKIIRSMIFRVRDVPERPVLYATDERGCPKSGFLIGEEDVWVTARNFPKGSIIRLWVVKKNPEMKDSTQLEDQTKQYDGGFPPLLELPADETSFERELWPREHTSLGSYDIIAEVITYDQRGRYHAHAQARVQDIVSNLTYSGFVVQRRPGMAEPLEFDIAGTVHSPFTFRETFLTTENVYVGVDPCIQPSYIGKTANVYIVSNKSDAQWTIDPSLNDVTGFVETITVGGVCGNCWSTLAWTHPLVPGQYDVVLDFDQNGVYTPGVDLIDGLDRAGFVVSGIRVNSISFNYGGSGVNTIYDNVQKANIAAPEYYSANHVVKPAAWPMGGSRSVQVAFEAVPSITSAQIWAETGLGGLNSPSSPVAVSFTGGEGTATFAVNNNPNFVGKHLFNWNWKYKNVNGSTSPTGDMGATGEHVLFTTFSVPDAPMTTPWLEALEYASKWASGQTSEAGVVSTLINGIYNSGMVYDGWQHHTSGATSFNLTSVFDELRTAGLVVYMDCRDCANFFHVLSNALGFHHQYLRIPGSFTYEPIKPMGWSSCSGGGWSFHQVGWCGSSVADGSAKLSCTILAICNYSAADYINLLTKTPGIAAGPTGICSPY